MVNALILAGVERDNKLGLQVKANVDINGKPMIEYVVESLKECSAIEKIAVIGPYEDINNTIGGKVDIILQSKGSIMENLLEGAKYFGQQESLLVCTCDIPMLTPEAVNDFIHKCMASGADFCYPIVERRVNDQKFQGIIRTYTTLKEGTFTGGNIFFICPEVIDRCSERAKQLIASRKNVLKMAGILGWITLLRLIFKRLSIPQAESRFSKIFNIKARAIISTYPELANDVDKPSDLEYVKSYLKKRGRLIS